jgi:S1-C subfamily serine protease
MRNTDLFDDYLTGRLDLAASKSFEARLEVDSDFNEEFRTHRFLIEAIEYSENKNVLQVQMEKIHEKEFGKSNIVSLSPSVNYWKVAAVAAAVAIFVFINGAVIFKGIEKNRKNSEQMVSHVVNETAREITDWMKNRYISKKTKRVYAPANIEATGFCISTKGYFLTSLHSVKNADSVMVQNEVLDFVPAERVWEDARLDVAIYKLKDLSKMKEVPISFRNSDLDLGEKVFALGYPRETVVYSEGNVSAASGILGDTSKYQLSLLVNPGNSGSPVLDEKGNLVGIISSRNDDAQGVSYAVKATYILDMIKNIPDEKLKNEILVNGKNTVKNMKRTDQVSKLKPFVYNIMVYNSHLAQ